MKATKAEGGNPPLISVILAGGGGKRLFPISTQDNPKYLLKIGSEKTLLEETIGRAQNVSKKLQKKTKIIVVCNSKQVLSVRKNLKGEDIDIIPEPEAKNTAPAICLSALEVMKKIGGDAVMLVMPSDHKIEKIERFIEAVNIGYKSAIDGNIVTFGVKPTYPETGYGYIEISEQLQDGVHKIRRFTEKPSYDKAKIFVESGGFLWNSGIFMFKAETIIEELKKYTDIPEIMLSYDLKKAYRLVPNISIDYAVCEKSDKIVCIPTDFTWSDIGSFRSIKQFLESDSRGNAGQAQFFDSDECLYISDGKNKKRKKVIFFGLKRIAVAEGENYILILPLERDQEVKDICDKVS
ncbi:MAG: mannose-1-phosphate guanylyltransferase [bacterium]|nr:mannose-1-phosphate guanylyltransferase [bacterium]